MKFSARYSIIGGVWAVGALSGYLWAHLEGKPGDAQPTGAAAQANLGAPPSLSSDDQNPQPDPRPAAALNPALAALPPLQQTALAERQSLMRDLQEVQRKNQGDKQKLAAALADWRQRNADKIAGIDELNALAAKSAKTAAAARQAAGLANRTPAPTNSAPPKTKALLDARAQSFRELQQLNDQTKGLPVEQRQAAIDQWQAQNAQRLDSLAKDAQAESRMLAAQPREKRGLGQIVTGPNIPDQSFR